jgi:signal transduction histidine kinase
MVRLDKSEPGTGVGLSTCRRIVEAHGGRIGLDAAPDGGTVAWFELPA